MTNIEHVEKLRKEYKALTCRINLLEKLQERVIESVEGGGTVQKMMIYSCSGKVVNKTELVKQDHLITQLIDKTNHLVNDLERLKYTKDIIDGGLDMIKLIDERYFKVISKHYIHGVRMEEVADWLYISRSRCYEICKLALKEMSELLFGLKAS